MKKVLYILGKLKDSDVDWLVEEGARRSFPEGAVLITEGQPVDEIYMVIDGSVDVTAAALPGKVLANLGSGEVLGELSFLDDRPPTATVTTSEHSLILAIPRQRLLARLERDDNFPQHFFRGLGRSLASRFRSTFSGGGDDDSPGGGGTDKLNFFDALSEEDREELREEGSVRDVDPGEAILTEGEPSEAMFVIETGEFVVKKGDHVLATLGAGEVLGELGFLDSRPPTATVEATQPSQVLELIREDLAEELAINDSFASRLYRALGTFLASRFRSSLVASTYDASGHLEEGVEYRDELDEDLLDEISLAGTKFAWMMERLRTG